MKPFTYLQRAIGIAPPTQMLLSLAIAGCLAFFALSTDLYRVEAYFYDLRMQLKSDDQPDPRLLLLPLSDRSGASNSIHTQLELLKKLLAQRPQEILYLNHFDPSEVETAPAEAQEFVALAQQAASQGTKIFMGTDVDLSGEVLPPYPLSLLPHYPAILHRDGTMFAEDKVVRRGLLTALEEPSLHVRAAYPFLSDADLLRKIPSIRGAYFYRPGDAWHMLIRYPGNTAGDRARFPRLSLAEALAGGATRAAGKIVLIDDLRKDNLNDYAYTPYSREAFVTPRLVVHASFIDSLLKNNGLRLISRYVDVATTFLLALVLSFVAITMRPSRGILALLCLSFALLLLAELLFQFGYALRLVHPLIAMFFTYYLIVPYRAIFEYKKRWEVQEKHDLLVQVEEMKGNFLSLMSHDLKTPVAQIQGLAELVIRQGNLGDDQSAAMKQVLQSTENLDKFISKILNLTKVESNEIKLNKRSKDVNKLLEQCVEKLSFQAKAKDIGVEMHLEPLFPIPVDPALVIQVFTNIIDNAIKYSPAGSSVRISSRERGEHVEVTIEDSGHGLDEKEMQQLFTKFFRGRSHPGDPAKGSGLGLYLSRYFIELHRGKVAAESRKGAGSRFIIQLPLQDFVS